MIQTPKNWSLAFVAKKAGEWGANSETGLAGRLCGFRPLRSGVVMGKGLF
ncbi:MAG: hypothetical protein ACYCYG_01220 [Bellilinea sp.]